MIDREILATRLSKLREALRRLRSIAAKSHAEYRASEIDQALAEHYLRLALEAMLDTGNHLIAAGCRRLSQTPAIKRHPPYPQRKRRYYPRTGRQAGKGDWIAEPTRSWLYRH